MARRAYSAVWEIMPFTALDLLWISYLLLHNIRRDVDGQCECLGHRDPMSNIRPFQPPWAIIDFGG